MDDEINNSPENQSIRSAEEEYGDGSSKKVKRRPETVEELKEYFTANLIPVNKVRFFPGEDIREPKAFGIFKDADGNVTVYKNKADGSRAVRYSGPDEKHAVDEFFDKFLDEREKQLALGNVRRKGSPSREEMSRGGTSKNNKSGKMIRTAVVAFVLLNAGILGVTTLMTGRHAGYYRYNNSYYYQDSSDRWFGYAGDWLLVDPPDELEDNYKDYSLGTDFDSSWGVTNAKDSYNYQYYNNPSSSDDDDSSGWSDDDYDYDDWDSDSTDWDSDW